MPDLPSVVNNVQDLERALAAEDIVGIPLANIVKLLDVEEPSTIAEQLAETAAAADDMLLVYYAGHGLIGETANLLLSTPKTKQVSGEYSSLPIDTVKRAIRSSPAKTKILILDCCFSGRAIDIMSGDADVVRASVDVAGTYAMASAPATKAASAPAGARYTAFTGALLETLERGIDAEADELTIETLFQELKARLNREGSPEPQRINFQGADKFRFALNRYRHANNSSAIRQLEARLTAVTEEVAQFRRVVEAAPQTDPVALERRVAALEHSAMAPVPAQGPPLSLRTKIGSLYFFLLFPTAVVAGFYFLLWNFTDARADVLSLLVIFMLIAAVPCVFGAVAVATHTRTFERIFGTWLLPQAALWGGLVAGLGVYITYLTFPYG